MFFALGCTTLALAQGEVTLQNPSFEEDDITQLAADATRSATDETTGATTGAYTLTGAPTGWTLTNTPSVCDIMTADAAATDNDFGAPGAPSDGNQMLYLRDSWSSGTTTTLTQKVTLAAGTYKVTVDSKCIHNGATNVSPAKLVAGGEHAELPYHSLFVPDNWDKTSVTFRIDAETEVEIGVEVTFNNGQAGFSILLDNFTIAETTDVELTAHYEEAEFSHWSISGNSGGSFQLNTWSYEADTESGMAVPFIEYWVGAGGVLSDATISHQQLQGLPAGNYIVSVFARAFNEAGEDATSTADAVGKGITFTANGQSVDLTTGTAGTFGYSTEVYGVYELNCTVGSDGTLDIGFTVASETACDWMAFKDLKVVMDTKDYPTLTAPTGEMDPDVQAAMEAAIAAYEADPSGDNFFAAIEAIQDAYASIAAYAADLKGGDYLIMTSDGYYLGGGLLWGTQASIIGKPQFINLEVQTNGTFHLDAHQYNGEAAHYLGSNLYFDNGTPVDWTVEAVSGGYTIYGNGGYLAGGNGFQTEAYISSTPYVWTLLTMDDVVASMSEASATNPVDVTALIKAPELKRNSNTTYYPTWTVTGYDGTGTPSNYAFGGNGEVTASCAESYHSTNGFNFSQEITLPKAGYYTLSAKGFYRIDGSVDPRPVLYAGDATSTFPQITRTDEYLGVEDNMANAYQEFLLGLHQIDAIPITAAADGETITIGFKGENTGNWNIMGELELLYYADAPDHECTASLDHWKTTGTTGIASNTWSYEGDASDLTTPFLQVWLASGNTLEAQTISHTTIEDLPAGVYTVSMAIRIFSEAGNAIGTGTTFNANGVSEDLVSYGTSGSYGEETEVYGTYTLTCTVGTDGTLDISIVIPDGVSYNWIAFKDLKVVYLSGPIEWTLGAEYGTLILPFAYDLTADGLTAYTVESITDATAATSAMLNLSTGTTSIAANTPYIIGGTTTGTYSFIGVPTNDKDSYADSYLTGVLETTTVPNNGSTYVLQNQTQTDASGLAFYLVNSNDITCGAYHCYLNYTAPAGVKMVVNFPDGTTTGIEAVDSEAEAGSDVIYDLSGRRVAKAQKGVYIVNGKKVVIK